MSRWLAPAGTAIGARELLAWSRNARGCRDVRTLFAREVRERLGVQHCFFLSSGRAALVLTLRALRSLAGPGRDEVVLPAYTCYSVPAAVVRAGLKIRVCEVDPGTLDYDHEELRERTDFTRVLCVLTSSLYGLPNDLPALERLARERGVFLLDDAAQSFGASVAGRPVGTFGDAGILSFDKGKNITSVEGGVIVTSSEPLAEVLRREITRLSLPAWPARLIKIAKVLAYVAFLRPRLYGIPARIPQLGLGVTIYDTRFPLEEYDPLLAALALALFRKLDEITARRRENAAQLRDLLRDITGLRLFRPRADMEPAWLRYPLLVDAHDRRNELFHALGAGRLGASRSYPMTIDGIPELQAHLVGERREFPGGRSIARGVLTLPTHGYITERDRTSISAVVNAWAGSHGTEQPAATGGGY